MIDKSVFKDILIQYGMKYSELMNVASSFERGDRPSDDFFKCSVLPGKLFVEPTNRCNKNCVYCARDSMNRTFHDLSSDAFANIVDKIPRGIYISLTGNGEPLLNKYIYSMISLARAKGLLVGLITNGTLLTEKNARKLIESAPNKVQISFDAIDKDVYNKMYRSPSGALSYERVLAKILKFLYLERAQHRNGIFVTISSVLTDAVQEVRAKSSSFWESLPIDNYFESPAFSLQTDSGLSEERRVKSEEPWQICPTPWITLKINSDGSVNPCCHDFSSKYVIGNINKSPLAEIFNSEKAVALRKALYYRDVPFFEKIGYNCHKCNVWHSDIGHNIRGYLTSSYPIACGFMILESASVNAQWGEEHMLFLEEQLRSLNTGE